MSDSEPSSKLRDAAGWQEYWTRTTEAAAYRRGGPQEQVLAEFWRGLFAEFATRMPRGRIVDIACGNGALFHHLPPGGDDGPLLVGLDDSCAAIVELRARFPRAAGVVADIRAAPFGEGAFDLVASQFGVEYAGLAGIEQALGLVGRGGILALVLHLRDGAMYRENLANRLAMDRLREAGLLGAMRSYFEAFEALGSGRGSRPALRAAGEALQGALARTAALLSQAGSAIAGGAILRMHEDSLHMSGRPEAFDAREVITWAERNAAENEAYARRMSAMIAASLGEGEVDELVARAGRLGLRSRIRDRLVMGRGGEPAAWVLVCERL